MDAGISASVAGLARSRCRCRCKWDLICVTVTEVLRMNPLMFLGRATNGPPHCSRSCKGLAGERRWYNCGRCWQGCGRPSPGCPREQGLHRAGPAHIFNCLQEVLVQLLCKATKPAPP